MKKSIGIVLMTIMLAMVVAACGANGDSKGSNGTGGANNGGSNSTTPPAAEETKELTIKHKLGETKVAKNPQKVVVFDFGVLDSLDKLGVEVTGVPQASIPPYLSKYADAKYENVGSLKEPDFEKLSAIKPDLIIISGRQSDAYDELTKLGPTIFLGVDTAKYMESYTENAKTLGTIFGKEAEVEAELASVTEQIKALNEKVTAAGDKKALILLTNEGAISAYGAGSRFGIIHDVFGFKPADDGIKVTTHGDTVSFEYVAEKNPDYLFVVDRDAAVSKESGESGSKALIENALVKNTNAFKEGNIVYLDPNFWYLSGGGLISVAEMVKEVAAAMK
ncbi:siderophore ABC transporter substrate-binding protein [Paenibacillus radicis (ex Gao et al. 2016)]|uniref:ABC transporter solute-binding protein YclQ n=1 Tax=Paenibacillus radicis (ex Gao et al. 2016) TaxID=1737354 RepID=A0A917M343_9BACL|nr:siderophore ABC transporter substrate-binding protein [Paenibacillus radicis (ex Gao et al. 2016)]GGG73899.1 putative ABC transporter solute-binding protein YclQ [Paenibacillus radicis (ex Gao et al. 2016)]